MDRARSTRATGKREPNALRRRPPGPTASLSLNTLSVVLSFPAPVAICDPGKYGRAVVRLLALQRPARLPKRRTNPFVREKKVRQMK